MNDDELIDRLRRTLKAEADAVTPMSGAPRVGPHAGGGVVRTRRTPPRRAVVALAAAAVTALTVGISLHARGRQTLTVGQAAQPPVSVPTRPDAPATTVRAPTTTLPTATTVPAPAITTPTTGVPAVPTPTAVPVDFVPSSFTFATTTLGWVLGTEPCGSVSCLHVAHTVDGGASWVDQGGPDTSDMVVPGEHGRSSLQVRFADAEDGWIVDTAPGADLIWSSHDGGTTWNRQTLPGGAGATIASLETAGGEVTAAVAATTGTVVVSSTSVGSDSFAYDLSLPAGPGASPTVDMVLQGAAGWLVVDDSGSTVAGARLGAGTWTPWSTLPCTTPSTTRPSGATPATGAPPTTAATGGATTATTDAPTPPGATGATTTAAAPATAPGGAALLAAPAATDLVAVCGPTTAGGPQTVLTSNDGGATYAVTAVVPSADQVSAVASPAAGTLVGVATAAPGTLVASADSGAGWQTVYGSGGGSVEQLGFEDASQGFAVLTGGSGSAALLRTGDAGASWTAVDLQA